MNIKGKEHIVEWFLITVSVIILSMGTYFFKFPNNFTFGGVTGIAVIVGKYVAFSPSDITFILNTALLVLGFLFIGKDFGVKTVYVSILMSFVLWVLEKACPLSQPLTSQPVIELAYAIFLPGVGSAILFNIGASSGGTDIIAMIVRKYTSFDIGTALFASDVLICLTSFYVFGIETGLISFVGLMIKSLIVDTVIENINLCKVFNVTCDHPEPICKFILKDLKRSATIYEAQGAFSHDKKMVVSTVVKRHQAVQLRNFIRKIEPDAFISITNSSEIIGKGFHR